MIWADNYRTGAVGGPELFAAQVDGAVETGGSEQANATAPESSSGPTGPLSTTAPQARVHGFRGQRRPDPLGGRQLQHRRSGPDRHRLSEIAGNLAMNVSGLFWSSRCSFLALLAGSAFALPERAARYGRAALPGQQSGPRHRAQHEGDDRGLNAEAAAGQQVGPSMTGWMRPGST